MKKQLLILALALILNLAQSFNPVLAQQDNDNQLAIEIDQLLAGQFTNDAPGLTALVARNGKVIYMNAFGMANLELNAPMQLDNVFRIGSITKQFTAIAILQLMEQGKLNLQDEITRFIPKYPTAGHVITIENLLTHTSGIRDYTAMDDYFHRMSLDIEPVAMIDHFKNEPMNFAPGTRFEYSNSGYFLLGYIIETITGKTYQEYLEENFFMPLGMTSTIYGSDVRIIKNRAGAYSEGDNGYENAKPLSMTQPYSAGSILSTVEDLFKWHQAVISFKLVKKENLEKAFTSYKLADGKQSGYGYGWRFKHVDERPTIEHGGGINGFTSMAIYLPHEDVYVAVLSNCDCNRAEDIASKLAALAIGKATLARIEIKVDHKILDTYVGEYEITPEFIFSVTRDNDRLFVKATGQDTFEIFPETNTKFFLKINDAQLEFVTDDSGIVTKAVLDQNRRKTDALRIR